MINARQLIGTHNIVFITLDTLRFDVARQTWARGQTPEMAALIGPEGWECRHTPGSFTFAAHAAFFAGFLPTPATPGIHPRLFALAFPGSESTGPTTAVFETPDIVSGFEAAGYHTICIGGVGFFNKRSPLGNVFPSLFRESHWCPEFGVTEPCSTEYQVDQALRSVAALDARTRVFLFVNVSAIHQPNRHYRPGHSEDSIETHAAALEYVDAHIGRLFRKLARRAPLLAIMCSDHGTAYGEDGYTGHRLAHPVVWTVPYAEFLLDRVE